MIYRQHFRGQRARIHPPDPPIQSQNPHLCELLWSIFPARSERFKSPTRHIANILSINRQIKDEAQFYFRAEVEFQVSWCSCLKSWVCQSPSLPGSYPIPSLQYVRWMVIFCDMDKHLLATMFDQCSLHQLFTSETTLYLCYRHHTSSELNTMKRDEIKRFWMYMSRWSNIRGQYCHARGAARRGTTSLAMTIVFDVPDIAVYHANSEYYCIILEEHLSDIKTNSLPWIETTVPAFTGMVGFRASSIPNLKQMYERMLKGQELQYSMSFPGYQKGISMEVDKYLGS